MGEGDDARPIRPGLIPGRSRYTTDRVTPRELKRLAGCRAFASVLWASTPQQNAERPRRWPTPRRQRQPRSSRHRGSGLTVTRPMPASAGSRPAGVPPADHRDPGIAGSGGFRTAGPPQRLGSRPPRRRDTVEENFPLAITNIAAGAVRSHLPRHWLYQQPPRRRDRLAARVDAQERLGRSGLTRSIGRPADTLRSKTIVVAGVIRVAGVADLAGSGAGTANDSSLPPGMTG